MLVLYTCSESADVIDADRSGAVPRRSQTVGAQFRQRRWEIGYRLGAALRQAREMHAQETATPTGRTVAPHLRSAHYHVYYTGVGSRRDPSLRVPVLRWRPRIPVGIEEPEPVVRRLKGR